MPPQMVNAYYNPLMNEIVFPAAILQYPFFDAGGRDAAANYGGIGSVIGHEIGHGFDDQGSRYDGDGKLQDWWTDEDRAAFEQRTASLIAQYDALVPEGGLAAEHHVNGALTIGENIGDLGARHRAQGLRDRARRPGGARGRRVHRRAAAAAQLGSGVAAEEPRGRDDPLLTIDPHSPNEFRCNQILRNIDAFYDAFDVTESDRLWLAPEERVTIW